MIIAPDIRGISRLSSIFHPKIFRSKPSISIAVVAPASEIHHLAKNCAAIVPVIIPAMTPSHVFLGFRYGSFPCIPIR